ncbi:MAG: hypothetical protein HUJ62_01300, partial [Streptococcus gallolyticus]|nr:hypothetical protein [Streptococcus gallolyticus]
SGSNSNSQNSNFKIEGKWKSVGTWGVGQAQPGSIVTFDGKNCNLVSPSDTYAFYKQGNGYILDATTALFSQNTSFNVKIIDNNNIELSAGSGTNVTKLQRVG